MRSMVRWWYHGFGVLNEELFMLTGNLAHGDIIAYQPLRWSKELNHSNTRWTNDDFGGLVQSGAVMSASALQRFDVGINRVSIRTKFKENADSW